MNKRLKRAQKRYWNLTKKWDKITNNTSIEYYYYYINVLYWASILDNHWIDHRNDLDYHFFYK